jgi:predicted metal-binding membrane protein
MTPAARERLRVRVPLLLISGIAWILIVVGPGGEALSSHHGAAMLQAARPVSMDFLLAHTSPSTFVMGLALMVAAMMFPQLTGPVSHVRTQNFLHRRERTIVLFLAGYTATWMAAAALIAVLSLMLQLVLSKPLLVMLSNVLIVLVWQCSPVKQRCLNRSHAHPPLAAFGAAGYLDALRFAVMRAGWCAGSCWALMLLPWLAPGGHVVAMAAVTLWVIAERLDRPARPRWRLRRPR